MVQVKMADESDEVSPRSHPLHHCPHPTPAERAFGTPEVFEKIFALLLKDSVRQAVLETEHRETLHLLRNRTVCKAFKSNIDNSTLLQDLMYFNTPNSRSRLLYHNPCIGLEPSFRGGVRPVVVKQGFNEIFDKWDSGKFFFKTSASLGATEDEPLWVFEGMRFGFIPQNGSSTDPATVYRTHIAVMFSKYRKNHQYDWELPKQKIMAPGPYLNMRFADPCCKVGLIAEIKEGGQRGNSAARCIRGDLQDCATFGEVLEWLDLWEARQHGQSNLVTNVRSNGCTLM